MAIPPQTILNILALRSHGHLDVAIRVAEDIDEVRMPPMLLVPLVAPAADAPIPLPRHDGSIRTDAQ